MRSFQRGFTLVELLVVVAILGILYSVSTLFFIAKPLENSRDIVRKRDVDAIAEAYTAKAADTNTYSPLTNADFAQGRLPTPPEGGQYQGLLTQNSEDFEVCAELEKGKGLNCLLNSDNPDCYCRFSSKRAPSPTPTSVSSSTPSPSACPAPSSVPSPSPIPQTYALDDTKFLATYAVLMYTNPGIPSPWMVDISFRPDFCGVRAEKKYNPYLYYVPANADTIIGVAYAADGTFGSPGSSSEVAFRSKTSKLVAFISQPYLWTSYLQGCGKTIYWRLVNYYDDTKVGPTYANIVDCNTKVGVVDPPLSWYTVFNVVTNTQKQYDPSYDFDHNGVIDWNDYIIGSLSTKARAGGWQPPE